MNLGIIWFKILAKFKLVAGKKLNFAKILIICFQIHMLDNQLLLLALLLTA